MSGYLQGQVWFREVRGSERDVLLAMADHGDDDGTRIYPSMDYLAWKVGLSKRRTQQIVSAMRERGVLIVVREATRYDPTHYRMRLEALPEKAARPGVQSASPLAVRGEIAEPAGVQSERGRGEAQSSPKPSREPSVEPSATGSARAQAELPEDFPDELRPHLRGVYRVLRDLAQRQGARAVAPLSLANVIMARPFKPLVRSAHDYAAWADSKAQRRKDVVSGYRNWLDRVDDAAQTERVDSEGRLTVHDVPRPNGNGNGRGVLHSMTFDDGRSWEELLPHEKRHAMEMYSNGRDPSKPSEEPVPIVPSGRPDFLSSVLADSA